MLMGATKLLQVSEISCQKWSCTFKTIGLNVRTGNSSSKDIFQFHAVNIYIVYYFLTDFPVFALKKKSLEKFSVTFLIPSGSPGIVVVSVWQACQMNT